MTYTKRTLTQALTFELASVSPNAIVCIVDQNGIGYDIEEVLVDPDGEHPQVILLRVRAAEEGITEVDDRGTIYDDYHFAGVNGD